MDNKEEIRRKAAMNVANALHEAELKQLAEKKRAEKEALFRNSLGIRLKKKNSGSN